MNGSTLLATLAMVFVMAPAVTRSQSGTPQRPAVDITNADIRATIRTAPTDAVTDQQIRVVDIGTYNVAVGVLHRAAKAKQRRFFGTVAHATRTSPGIGNDGP